MDMLRVNGNQIVDAQGRSVRLRGTCLGGWMNMENFINGYPGAEHSLRAAIARLLGPARGEFFFDRLLDHFFAEDDIAFLKACGSSVVRLPLNYRHFESDAEPFQYNAAGFQRLDKVVDWCAKHGLYVILDLHSVQGWQNTDWHCDNAGRSSLFWQQKQFQDRFVALWEEFARHYAGNATIAGYNVMNEPVTNAPDGRFSDAYTPDYPAINGVYRRVVSAIRAIDPQHIVFLEGDYFSSRFMGFDAPFAANLVYSSHNYNAAGFGPGAYPGEFHGEHWDKAKQEEVFANHEGTRFTQQHTVPLWVGEFGAVYNGPERQEADRLRALDDQIAVFEQYGAHWTTWTYKDVGVMGWVELNPDSPYMQLIAPILNAKRELDTDFWQGWMPPTPVKDKVRELSQLAAATIGDPDVDPAANYRYMSQAVLDNYVGGLMLPSFAGKFAGMSEAELDEVLSSFAFKNCRQHQGLIEVLGKHLDSPA
jgi:endoglucanase